MIKKILILVLLFILMPGMSFGAHLYPEKYYQNEWCSKWGGTAEYRLLDKTRVDCLTKTYAAEFDFAPKWAEAIGQSLYYAKMTGKKPAIILIIEKEEDFVYFKRAEILAKDNNIALWYMKKPENYVKTMKKSPVNSYNSGEMIYISFRDIEKFLSGVFRFLENIL